MSVHNTESHLIEQLLTNAGIQTVDEDHHHGRSGWKNLDCPYCGQGTNKFHMGLNLSGLYVNCWKCGQHRLVDTLIELGVPKREAWQAYKTTKPPQDVYKPVQRGSLCLPKSDAIGTPHRRYLKLRGFDPAEIVRLWQVTGIRFTPGLEWRLLIPIHYHGEVVSWTTRATTRTKLRYKSASPKQESMNHKHLLYGEDYCRHAVIVHEGPLDVWATGPGAVATCGTSWTQAQVLKIAKYPVRVVCYDTSTAAQKRARELCDLLEVYPGNTFNVLLESGEDSADADPAEIEQLRNEFLV